MRRLLAATLLLVCACFTEVNVNKPKGDAAGLALVSGPVGVVELLALDDTCLYVGGDAGIRRVYLTDVTRVSAREYSHSPGRITAATLLGLAGVVAASRGLVGQVWPVVIAAAVVTPPAVWFALTGDRGFQTDFRPPFSVGGRRRLSLFCRYPQGLTPEQWHELLAFNRQDGFLAVPAR